jgi:hypothetical protein
MEAKYSFLNPSESEYFCPEVEFTVVKSRGSRSWISFAIHKHQARFNNPQQALDFHQDFSINLQYKFVYE